MSARPPCPDRRDWMARCARGGAVLAVGALGTGPGAMGARAQTRPPSARPWRIVAVTYRGRTEVEDGFEAHFRERGLPIEFIHRDIALDATRLPALVPEIRALRPDLVTTWGTPVTLGLVGPWNGADPQRHLTELPVVFSLVAAPVSSGLVPSMASSGRNLTGVSHVPPLASQMQVMADYRPFRRVGVLHSPNEANTQAVLQALRERGRARGFEVMDRPFATNPAGQPVAEGARERVAALRAAGAEWLYLPPDSFLGTQLRSAVLPEALAQRLPTFASTEQQIAAGALTGLVSRYASVGRFAAYKAEQILREGRAPASLPVETLSRFALQVRLPLARALGLPPPLAWFNRAELLDG